MAAPQGNSNAKRGTEWREAIRAAVKRYESDDIKRGQALERVAKKVVSMALDGDMQAIKEIGDRLDGRAVQAIAGEDGGPLVIEIVKFASTDTK